MDLKGRSSHPSGQVYMKIFSSQVFPVLAFRRELICEVRGRNAGRGHVLGDIEPRVVKLALEDHHD